MSNQKTVLFISHATPDDNDFVRWLSAKLTLAGYSVWYDLERLKGGDLIWDEIEDALRNKAVRCLAVVSNKSYQKDGVKKEWAVAATVEKQIAGFTIPLRLDKFDYSQLPILLHQKNVIDFNRGWHFGLSDLLDTLADAGIPQHPVDVSLARAWLPPKQDGAIVFTDQQEVLDSNVVLIEALPAAIETTRIRSSDRQIAVTDKNRKVPWFEYGEFVVGFAPSRVLIDLFKPAVPLEQDHAVETQEFLRGRAKSISITEQEARYRVVHLIKQAWDLKMEALGLQPHTLANERAIWYVPIGLSPTGKFPFREPSGATRRKQLSGRSERYGVNWHYAVSAMPLLTVPSRIELHAHIVFSDADGKPLASHKRMHRLRRSFCKSWWNDRWRGFLLAFLHLASGGTSSIELPAGGQRVVRIAATPTSFLSSRGLSDYTAPLVEDEAVELVASEEFDVDDDDDAEDEEPDEA